MAEVSGVVAAIMVHESDERNLLQPLRTAAGTLFVMWAVLRVVLWWQFGRAADIGAGALSWILPAGVLSDLVVLVYLLLPFTLYLSAPGVPDLESGW